jgi:TatD DNase family protein
MKYDLFDTHAHYTDKRFETEHEGGAEELLRALFGDDVGTIINVATDPDNALEVIAQAKKFEGMYAAVGIHPSDCKALADADEALAKIEALLKNKEENKIVAIGEIGFDYYWEPYEKEKQYEYFYRQMCLAEKYSLPVVIHDRDAHGDTFDMIMRFPNVRGIIHSCSASAETVRQLCKTGNWYVSFSGTVTFKNAAKVREAAAATPIDRILSETDCPYLAPHPHRGKMNHSGLMRHTVTTLAEIHGKNDDEMRQILCENARKVFNLV